MENCLLPDFDGIEQVQLRLLQDVGGVIGKEIDFLIEGTLVLSVRSNCA